MKPDFALLLSFAGIALLRRASAYGDAGGGWYRLGEVSPDGTDLSNALKALRTAATSDGVDAGAVKLILPTEQVKFLDIAAPDGVSVAEAVEAALDGATPYSIDELVYDFQAKDGQIHIAAVARETLDEAESFALAHGFQPLGFVSDVASDAGFVREPFFGPTQTALTTLARGTSVQGDEMPITVRGDAPKAPADAPKAPAKEKAAAVAPRPEPTPPADAAPDEAPHEAKAKPSQPQKPTGPEDKAPAEAKPEQTPKPEAAHSPPPSAQPDVRLDATPAAKPNAAPKAAAASPVLRNAPAKANPAPAAKAPAAPNEPAAKPESAKATAAAAQKLARAALKNPAVGAAPAASAVPPAPGFASIRAHRESHAPRPDRTISALPSDMPGRRDTGPVAAPKPRDPNADVAASARASFTMRPKAQPEPEAPASAPVPAPPTIAPLDPSAEAATTAAKSVGFASRRVPQSPEPAQAAPADIRKPKFGKRRAASAAAASGAVIAEGERMTVFGARGGQHKIGGKPRFFGLILTAALVLLMLAAAAIASIFLDEGLAGLFPRNSETAIATAAIPEIDEIISPTVTPATEPPIEAVVVPETALALPATGAVIDIENAATVDLAALNQGVPALSQDLVDGQIGGLSVPFEAEALTPEQAEARYAATGIWQRAPVPPADLDQRAVGDLHVASIDPSVNVGDAVAIPTMREADTDGIPGRQTDPYAADAGFTFDANGLIEPTPAGVRHPAGFLLVAGPPPLKPPLRSGVEKQVKTALPVVQPDAAAPEADAPEATDGAPADTTTDPEDQTLAPAPAPVTTAVVDETLTGIRPRPRPGDLIEQNERANLGGISLAELREKRPRERPEQDEIKVEAEQDVEASAFAVAASVQPKRRPSNIDVLVAQALRAPDPAPPAAAPAPTPTAAVQPRTVQPSIPSGTSVAAAATEKNAINLRKVNLIGVYGKPSSRQALVRLANGRYKKVKVGDRIDGGRVSAISDGQLSYVKSGRNVVLRMPRG
ncbi:MULTISPECIES: hypothetical protein [unclassified Marinovum]